MISSILLYIIRIILINKFTNISLTRGNFIEIFWTIIPMLILLFLALPSLHLLYLTDETIDPVFSIKVIGHQWYWRYEYRDFYKKDFDSYIVNNFQDKDLFRLLDVDNYLVVPIRCQLRFLVSAIDVIHSFTIPSLGIKVDAVPGRINQIGVFIRRVGVFFGQCSEICGVNHRFIPIGIEVVNISNFYSWIKL